MRLRNAGEHLFKQISECNDLCGIDRFRDFAHHHCDDHKDDNAGYVEQKVNERGAFCVGARSKTCDDCHDARADVRTHREVDALVEVDEPRKCHSDCNGRHNRRTLNYGGENCAYQNEKNGIRYGCEKVFDGIESGKDFHRRTHHIETHEQHTEACEDTADFLCDVFFGERHSKRADTRKGCKHDAGGN